MAKQRPYKNPRFNIPEKSEISISDFPDDTRTTEFPDMNIPDLRRNVGGSWHGQTTSDQDWDDRAKDFTAPVSLPPRSSLVVKLVNSELVYRLEEYRNDKSVFAAFFWLLLGGVLGVVYDLFKTNDFPLNVSTIAFIFVLGISTLAFGGFSLAYHFRATNKLKEIRASEIVDGR